jgi:hypothetical protein
MRFNHMELTFARGTLTDEFREEVDAFYGSIFRVDGHRHRGRRPALPYSAPRR